MRIAALDLGSNSFHLAVVEANLDGTFVPLVRDREMLRLGNLVARTGRIGPEATVAALETLRRFRVLAEAHRADELIAIGTAALREAADGEELCERAEREVGVRIKVVDGIREAQLIFGAIRNSILLEPAPALCADLGGGSLELMVGDRTLLAYAASLHLGVGRLSEMFALSGAVGDKERKRLEHHVAAELAPVLEHALRLRPRMLVGTSGSLLCLVRMAVARRDGAVPETMNQLSVAAGDLRGLAEVIYSSTTEERAAMPGCEARRAELLPAGMAVLTGLLDGSGLEELTVCEWALREGIVLEAIGAHDRAEFSHDPRALRRASVLSLCRRSNWRQPHARRVAELAMRLFDETHDRHGLGPHERELLEFAALLHDIGEHISRVDHDRHGAYLIEHGGLRGFSPAEVRLLACVVRLHIRGGLRSSVEEYAALDQRDRARAAVLISILRVADALDSGHSGAVDALAINERDDRIELELRTRGDAEVELWSLRKKKELFERVFEAPLVPVVSPVGPAEYEALVEALERDA